MRDPHRVPVIIGVGEAVDRPRGSSSPRPSSRSPWMAQALKAAEADAGGGPVLPRLDLLDRVGLDRGGATPIRWGWLAPAVGH
ncbi:hypothetical protein ACRAWD_10290 [Caulobacter segnis]